jgi:putative DNA methylase
MKNSIVPFSLKDAPALIERLLPVQKLSAEAYKEQMANQGKTLTALGSYWKGRKPLILNKACILGCLLPVSKNSARDLAIFEMLMGMDMDSLELRLEEKNDKLSRFILNEERSVGHSAPYRDWVQAACRPEECGDELFVHIWKEVNDHLGTNAYSFPELIEQLGIMRFGHRPRLADTFCGSGQIPFEAARLGCDVYASDLNPIACMLTWGAFHIIGGSRETRADLNRQQQELMDKVQAEIDQLGVETDGDGWRAKAFLYCLECRCPQTGWMVPLIPSLVLSRGKMAIAVLVPDAVGKRYDIFARLGVTADELAEATKGTVRTDGRGQDPYLIHTVDGTEYRTKISTLRGDYRKDDGSNGSRLRLWEKHDFKPRLEDIFQERLYAIHWMRRKKGKKTFDYEFRSVTEKDLKRESIVIDYVEKHLAEWQAKGWVPDMRIEPGYNTDQPIRERGWSHWHHLFNPRQLMVNGLINSHSATAALKFGVNQAANWKSKLSSWDGSPGVDTTHQTFYNQALNTLFTYGTRSSASIAKPVNPSYKHFPSEQGELSIICGSVSEIVDLNDAYITDPPYGNAVNYDEILEFFIAWLRKNPPPEFADWVWDSRRSLAIKGEDEDFRRGMVAAYKRMTECMPDNGIQVIMFTHQSGAIWADMANIVWASGLQVTAAWYVVTETDSALREGSYVKGTVLLVCRKRIGMQKTTRDDLAWEIQEEVENQVNALIGLNQKAKGLYRDENVFEDADIQMAGYAAALRVLTRYAIIDGRDMTAEAIQPRVKGKTTFVDGLMGRGKNVLSQNNLSISNKIML